MIEIRRFQCADGTVPITEWLAKLRDAKVRAKLEIRFAGEISAPSLRISNELKGIGWNGNGEILEEGQPCGVDFAQ
jgi:hypothetical protein